MWLTLAFTSAALLGFYDAAKKKVLTGNAVLPVLLLNTLFSTLFFLPAILSAEFGLGWFDHTLLATAPGTWEAHALVVLKSAIVLTSWIFGYFGMKHLPITIVGPINATRPVMVLVGAFVIFGERCCSASTTCARRPSTWPLSSSACSSSGSVPAPLKKRVLGGQWNVPLVSRPVLHLRRKTKSETRKSRFSYFERSFR